MTITHEPDGTTLISGVHVDQSALYGLLNKARDLGLTLLSVQQNDSSVQAGTIDTIANY